MTIREFFSKPKTARTKARNEFIGRLFILPSMVMIGYFMTAGELFDETIKHIIGIDLWALFAWLLLLCYLINYASHTITLYQKYRKAKRIGAIVAP